MDFIIIPEHAFHIHRQSDEGSEYGQKPIIEPCGHHLCAHNGHYAGKGVHVVNAPLTPKMEK